MYWLGTASAEISDMARRFFYVKKEGSGEENALFNLEFENWVGSRC